MKCVNGWIDAEKLLPFESRLIEFYTPSLGEWHGRFLGYLEYEEHNEFKPAFISLDLENIPNVKWWREVVQVPDA